MSARGFTLVELLVTLVVFAIVAGFALPSFSKLVHETRTHSRALELYQATQLARTSAIVHNRRVTLSAEGQWSDGWKVFVDDNHNGRWEDRKSTRLNSSHVAISYAVFCLKKKKN